MSEIRIQLTGAKAAVVGAVVLVFLLVRIATIGDANSDDLDRAIRAELLNRIGAQTSEVLTDLDVTDQDAVRKLIEVADASGIDIHSVRVSRPLLELSSTSKPIVRVEFALPGNGQQTEYWRFDHSILAGWRYRRPSNVVSYYLNFF